MTRLAGFMFMTMCALQLTGCAALPDDSPVVEQLDTDTGATVTRVGHPLELYRDTFVQDATGRFAFIAPFESNNAGVRQLFLWIAVPLDSPADAAPPTLEVNGKPVALGTPGRAADFAGLRNSPYKIPTPWSSMYYYRIDAGIAGLLGEAADVAVTAGEATKDGTIRTRFAAPVGADSRLRDFAARTR